MYLNSLASMCFLRASDFTMNKSNIPEGKKENFYLPVCIQKG